MRQEQPTRLILVAHAPLASAFRELAMHAFPECAAEVDALDVPPDASLELVRQRLYSLLQSRASLPVLLLADVQGATPANAVTLVLPDFPAARAVSGLNAPMLWRTLCYREEPPERLAERAVGGGQRGISIL